MVLLEVIKFDKEAQKVEEMFWDTPNAGISFIYGEMIGARIVQKILENRNQGISSEGVVMQLMKIIIYNAKANVKGI